LASWVLVFVCLAGGVLFYRSLDVLWPLARTPLVIPEDRVVSLARKALERLGFELQGYRAASWVTVDREALDYVERAFGREQTQIWISRGLPLFEYRVSFKHPGETKTYLVVTHGDRSILGFSLRVEEDEAGGRVTEEKARSLAQGVVRDHLGLRSEDEALVERSVTSSERPARLDHRFVFERALSDDPELRERVTVTVAGERVVSAWRSLVVPAEAGRASRAAQAPGIALETVGFGLLSIAALGAFFVFLRRLQDGTVRLGRALVWPGVVLVCFMATTMLESASVFRSWDPLWPRWVSGLRHLVFGGIEQFWVLLVLLAVVAAGDALDRSGGLRRGESLWLLARGRILDRSVASASGRGCLVGLLCGGVMALAGLLLQWTVGASTSIQPRGFFFYPLNSDAPIATSLFFFWGVALAEELGYRFFGGTWLLGLTRRRWVAVLVPGLIYGLTHTRLDFLPPAEPFWGRALVLTLVGCVWGWAFFRFDALTVVLSHFTADLFIFNWPRLASGQSDVVAASILTICVPLVPALLWPLGRWIRSRLPAS
jgi:hypothetical protein